MLQQALEAAVEETARMERLGYDDVSERQDDAHGQIGGTATAQAQDASSSLFDKLSEQQLRSEHFETRAAALEQALMAFSATSAASLLP